MSLSALIGTRRLIEILDRLSASGLGPSRASIPGLLRLRLEPRDPGSVDVPRSIAVGGTVDGQVAGSVVVRSETTVPPEKTAAVKVAAVKTSTVKTAAVKTAAVKTAAVKTSAPETAAVGLGSSNADRGGEGDSSDGSSHQQFAVMGPSFSHSRSDFVIGPSRNLAGRPLMPRHNDVTLS